ncbi:MAG: hypothetical protein ACN6PN_16110, partial [Sphingobacterium sp.]
HTISLNKSTDVAENGSCKKTKKAKVHTDLNSLSTDLNPAIKHNRFYCTFIKNKEEKIRMKSS